MVVLALHFIEKIGKTLKSNINGGRGQLQSNMKVNLFNSYQKLQIIDLLL
jgi:hypothetical protein